MHDFFKTVENVGVIITGILVGAGFILSIIGVLIFRKRNGHLPKGQGYGQD